MKKAQEYEKHAQECQALARKAVSPEERAQLLAMAETWLGLAAQRVLIADASGTAGAGSGDENPPSS
jgi:hypothetical protein